MKELVEKNVKAAIRTALLEDGLSDTINLSYNDLDYDLEDIFLPRIKGPTDDNIFDQLHAECEAMAKATFNSIMLDLMTAQSIVYASLYDPA